MDGCQGFKGAGVGGNDSGGEIHTYDDDDGKACVRACVWIRQAGRQDRQAGRYKRKTI